MRSLLADWRAGALASKLPEGGAYPRAVFSFVDLAAGTPAALPTVANGPVSFF